jgi:dCTP deaminase
MMLSDRELRELQEKYLLVAPWNPDHLQPASIDLTLGNEFIANGAKFALTDGYQLAPREFILATTRESVSVPNHLSAQVKGRSTWARRGLVIESAGFVDPGFVGTLTLELYNFSNNTLWLPLGERICQIAYTLLTSPAERPYGSEGLGSHYQEQSGVTPAHD